MRKLATFTWSYTVEVSESFNELDIKHLADAKYEAYSQLHYSSGELTNLQEID